MGICWSSSPNDPTPTPTGTSQAQYSQSSTTTTTTSGSYNSNNTNTTTTTTSSSSSGSSGVNSSINSKFSVSSGGSELVSSPYSNGQILPTSNLKVFTFAELKAATKNFKADTLLGEGGFGKVFRGCLELGDHRTTTASKNSSGTTVVAVKKLNSESLQGVEEWQSEINFLGCLSHPNLVKLLGYCYEESELLLVYEYMQKGSLENHLFGRGSAVKPLSWDVRLQIAIGAARGLSFLHTSDKGIIYRDFKASNILLDASYNAKISDFGLAKLGPSASQSHVTTRVMGTYGYAAPEYMQTGHLYVKSDVFAFGVVLVEILTAQRALDINRPSGQHNLTEWIQPYLHDRRKLKSIMDSRLEGKYPAKAAFHIAQLASKCLAPEPKQRPSMKELVESLERIQAANEKIVEPRNRFSTHHRSPLHP